jgi:hypothetical protein
MANGQGGKGMVSALHKQWSKPQARPVADLHRPCLGKLLHPLLNAVSLSAHASVFKF